MTDYSNGSQLENEMDGLNLGAGAGVDNASLKARGIAQKARGSVEKVLGKVETVVGGATTEKVRATADKAIGRAEDLYTGTISRVDDELAQRPYRTLAIAAGVGVVLGLMLARRDRTIIYRAS